MAASVVEFSRPATTPTYTANNAVGSASGSAILVFPIGGIGNGDCIITSAELLVNLAAVPASMGNFRLHLFSSPPTAIADNVALTSLFTDRAGYQGYVDLGTPAVNGGALLVQADAINHHIFARADGATALYGVMLTAGAFLAASGTTFRVKINVVPVTS